jgi:hypothetical protein
LEFGHSDNLYHSETVEQGQPAVRFAEGIYKRVLLVYLGKASIREDFKPAKSLSSLPFGPWRREGDYLSGKEGMSQTSPSKKSLLFNSLLPTLKEQSAYFSLAAVKRALAAAEIELAENSLREYMSDAMSSGIVADAGRGWYSRHWQPVTLNPKPVAKIIREVKRAFPLLDFCCWSTLQFNPFAQHLIAQPTILLYAEIDTLDAVADALRAAGWDAWVNPSKADVERFVQPGEKTVVLRPSIVKQPACREHVAPIQKALVDLMVEASKLQLMDAAEAQRVLDSALASGLTQLPVLLGYAETKREKIESKEITY